MAGGWRERRRKKEEEGTAMIKVIGTSALLRFCRMVLSVSLVAK